MSPSPNPIMAYICPDCGKQIDGGSLAHQHADGEWIFTEDLRRWHQFRRWNHNSQWAGEIVGRGTRLKNAPP